MYIPALYLHNPASSKLMIYFHGNAEDLNLAREQLETLHDQCTLSILGVEYPGYGTYLNNGDSTEQKLKEDAEYIYKFCLNDMGIREKDIILCGRSIGSGPAAWLAANYNPGALCLLSAFTSVCAAASVSVGKFLSLFVAERFNNLVEVTRATCPTLIVHGRLDDIVPFDHGQ